MHRAVGQAGIVHQPDRSDAISQALSAYYDTWTASLGPTVMGLLQTAIGRKLTWTVARRTRRPTIQERFRAPGYGQPNSDRRTLPSFSYPDEGTILAEVLAVCLVYHLESPQVALSPTYFSPSFATPLERHSVNVYFCNESGTISAGAGVVFLSSEAAERHG